MKLSKTVRNARKAAPVAPSIPSGYRLMTPDEAAAAERAERAEHLEHAEDILAVGMRAYLAREGVFDRGHWTDAEKADEIRSIYGFVLNVLQDEGRLPRRMTVDQYMATNPIPE